jgi:hypothetical protein
LPIDSSIVDAVPKKRGPKTDVLEALLKRVDGLEKRLEDEKKSSASHSPASHSAMENSTSDSVERPKLNTDFANSATEDSAIYSPTPIR